MIDPDGDILLTSAYMEELGIAVSGSERIVKGKTYVSLRSMYPHVTFRFDEKALSLNITADPHFLQSSTYNLKRSEPQVLEYQDANSLFLNYQLFFSRSEDTNIFNVPFDVGIKIGEFSFLSNFSYMNSSLENDNREDFIRLFSSIVRDDRKSMRRLTIGDFRALTGELGGGAILGGVSLSKNFGINPYFIQFPSLDLSGLVYTPSEVELWSGGTLLRRERIAPGTFIFKNIPAIVGTNEATLVIRDINGQEERFTVPFYFSSLLLKPGIHEYNYGLGFQREEFGHDSFHYDEPAALFAHRYGFTDSFTGGLRAEFSKHLANIGLVSNLSINKLGSLNVALAYSAPSRQGFGYSVSYAYDNRMKGYGWIIGAKGLSKKYSNLSLTDKSDRSRLEVFSSLYYTPKRVGTFSLFCNYSDRYLSKDLQKITFRYTGRLSRQLSVDITASNTHEERTTNEVFLTFRYLFGHGALGSVSSRLSDDDEYNVLANVQRTPPTDRGIRYRVEAEKRHIQNQDTDRYDTELTYFGRHGIYSGGYSYIGNINTYSASMSGSISSVGGSIHFGQPIYDSFAIAKVGDLEGIDIHYNGVPVDKTDSNGEVHISRFSSYLDNRVSVNDRDIPLGYIIGTTKKIISPAFRSGSFVEFDVSKVQTIVGTISIIEKDEKKAAEFWRLILNVQNKELETATGRGGEFYLENIKPGTHPARIIQGEKQCDFALTIPQNDEFFLNLGNILCEPIITEER